MHELSICRSIVGIVTKHAAGRPVQTVNLQVGQLRQIVPDTLVYCWSLVCEDTGLAGSDLKVESIPAQVRCEDCDAVETIPTPALICPRCAGRRTSLVSGEEFLITSLELSEV
jgi:hydrogenase nickel incorporation protein HypA/HybF